MEIVRMLLAKGADARAKDRYWGATPLHHVSDFGGDDDRSELVKLLVENGADVRAENDDGETPLHRACYGAHFDTVKLLLEYDEALVDAKTEWWVHPVPGGCRCR